jgi:hypothetical protein
MDFRLSIGITVSYLTVRHAYEPDSQKSIPIFDPYHRFPEIKTGREQRGVRNRIYGPEREEPIALYE